MATATTQVQTPYSGPFGSSPPPFTGGFGPQTGPYAGINPQQYFGTTQDPNYQQQIQQRGPFARQNSYDQFGAGAYGLPDAYAGWSGPARNAVMGALQYSQQAQPAQNMYRQQMNTDWGKEFVSQASDIQGTAEASARRMASQNLARSGYGGGGVVSPFGAAQIEQESLARAGNMGAAARAGVIQGQQMNAEAGRNYLNSLAQNLQAFLTPAQLEVSRQAKVPGTSGVNYIGPAIQAAGSVIGGAM